ncbi:hypothetical protein CLD_A0099 (plasmid) [Clostridium botulinum B1 str. Okra]|uniref:Uncharacterized protein n=1 Tax=Clostridium botulinum (strain Okra / Type B1) TaxID=498213 RepID=B1INS6_CLOBK|nr:hypothetical protein CLD_A0099 [Clostridium botulinum B1 str. Okra]
MPIIEFMYINVHKHDEKISIRNLIILECLFIAPIIILGCVVFL